MRHNRPPYLLEKKGVRYGQLPIALAINMLIVCCFNIVFLHRVSKSSTRIAVVAVVVAVAAAAAVVALGASYTNRWPLFNSSYRISVSLRLE